MATQYNVSFACMDCRKSYEQAVNPAEQVPDEIPCPGCGEPAVNLGRHFTPPKDSEVRQWEKVKFLVSHGFRYQQIRSGTGDGDTIPYPATFEAARMFVIRYRHHSLNFKR
jgi:DNA-directed RNA polymerase subunit RPC12/RpoP